MLAPAFICRVITLDNVDESMILNDFLNFVGESERNLLRAALDNFESIAATDMDDLTDKFEDHKARRIPSGDNFRKTLIEIAEKELIQEPTYVIDIWHPYFEMFTPSFVDELLKSYTPASRKVVSLLSFPDEMSPPQRDVASYMKKFLKELDGTLIAKFLRFITGADIICTSEIKVEFNSETGFSSRPIAHTCASLLELPTDYTSYPDFRSQFLEVLNSKVWVMDII
ncbi:hypothetical protein FSP39_004086 [Pinctada imbricata]|uniref:HECT domain-containing protein n=1 Tax=Pinctada imbricata TaxID=66713 RepID=A0AA88YHL7_PINIB|nr:hypothetical protein FSP39_004086 [Pinctada imbricata]